MWEASREEILNKGKDRRIYIMSVGVVVALSELVRSPLSVGIALHQDSPALPFYISLEAVKRSQHSIWAALSQQATTVIMLSVTLYNSSWFWIDA